MGDQEPAAWLRAVCRELSEGDEVLVNGRDRALMVTGRATAEREPYRCDATIIELVGNGTEYTIEVPESRDKRPRLHWPSQGTALGKLIGELEVVGEDLPAVVGTSAAELGIDPR